MEVVVEGKGCGVSGWIDGETKEGWLGSKRVCDGA